MGAFIAFVMALAGCTSANPDPTNIDPGKTTTAVVTPSTTPAATPTPTPTKVYKPASASGPAENVPVPVLPAAAKEFSKKGLEEFARYWYSTLGYAYETGDMKPMMAITVADCKTCARVKENVENCYGSGGWIVGGQMTVHYSDSKFVLTPDGTYQAILMVQQAAVTSYLKDGKADVSLKATIARADIVVAKYSDNRWTALTAEHLTRD